jgi:hypothetical protein
MWAAPSLDVGGAVAVAGDDAEQVAVAAQLSQPLGDAGQHLVLLALGHRLGQVLEPSLQNLGQLVRRRLAVENRFERPRPDVGVGHAGVRELADVRRDAVEVVERALPRDGAGAAGAHQRAVDVEEQDAMGLLACHARIFLPERIWRELGRRWRALGRVRRG